MITIEALYFAYKTIKKRLFLNAVLELQLLLCMALLFNIVSTVQFNLLNNKILSYSDINDDYYLFLYDQFASMPDRPEVFEKVAKKELLKLDEISDIGEIKSLPIHYNNRNFDKSTQCYIYNQAIVDNMKCLLKKGIWFTEYKGEANIVPLIVCEKMGIKLNDTIEFYFPNKGTDISKPYTYKGVVIGVLNDLDYVYSFSKGGTMMGLDTLMKKVEDTIIIPDFFIDEKIIKNADDYHGKMLFINDKSEELEQKINELSIGIVTDIKKMSDVTSKNLASFLVSNGLVFIIFSLITMAGIGGNNGLQRITNEKNFSIYYMLGLSWKRCIQIELWRTIIMIGLPYLIFCFLFLTNHLGVFYDPNSSVANSLTLIIILLYTTLMYIGTSLSSVLSLAKNNPVDIIRRWE